VPGGSILRLVIAIHDLIFVAVVVSAWVTSRLSPGFCHLVLSPKDKRHLAIEATASTKAATWIGSTWARSTMPIPAQ
jgi:hypothetical protein